MNSTTKKILAIIASGALPVLAFAAPGSGGAAIGPVNGSGAQSPTTNTAQKTTVGTNQYGTIPPNAQSGMSSGKVSVKQNTNVKAKSTTQSTTTSGGRR
ncbi:MAG TPA: hypothetical protein VKS98_04285 [Chthoniobacterales bacterium]|nr:hypothetical protein [Chthoniobacterales bacterium]